MSDAILVQRTNDAAMIREFIAHPGMKILMAHLETQQGNQRDAWLNAKSPADAETIREKAKVVGLLMAELNSFLVKGHQASQIIKNKEQASQTPSTERK
jgi:hypothetical protein